MTIHEQLLTLVDLLKRYESEGVPSPNGCVVENTREVWYVHIFCGEDGNEVESYRVPRSYPEGSVRWMNKRCRWQDLDLTEKSLSKPMVAMLEKMEESN